MTAVNNVQVIARELYKCYKVGDKNIATKAEAKKFASNCVKGLDQSERKLLIQIINCNRLTPKSRQDLAKRETEVIALEKKLLNMKKLAHIPKRNSNLLKKIARAYKNTCKSRTASKKIFNALDASYKRYPHLFTQSPRV